MTFAEMKDFEKVYDVMWLGYINGGHQYLPRSTTRAKVREAVNMLCDEPADSAEIRVALYELWLTTKHEKMNAEDRDAQLAIYCKRLAEHPAEHVRLVLSDLSREAKFFPAWSDIQERLDRIRGPRAALTAGLRNAYRKITEE